MKLEHLLESIQYDLNNEYKHMLFYLQSSYLVSGLHQLTLSDFLKDQAKSEMEHVCQFADLIISLKGTPTIDYTLISNMPKESDPKLILEYALDMEESVVENYMARITQTSELVIPYDSSTNKYIQCFFEDQLMHSKEDLNHIKKLLCR